MGAGVLREPAAAKPIGRAEWIQYAVIVALYLALNLITADRSPTVAKDEAIFTEPALNLIHGRGFTVEGWNGQRDHFWTGNAPLYSLALSGWLAIMPFSPRGVRSFNYLLALGAAILILSATVRARIFLTRSSRVLLFAALLCTYSISFSYRSGRYDCMGLFLFAIGYYGATLDVAWMRIGVVAIAGFFVPWAGFQLPVLGLTLSLVTILIVRRGLGDVLLSFWTAAFVGACTLMLLYARFGVLREFISTITRHSIVHGPLAEPTIYNTIQLKWGRLPSVLFVDPLSLVLAAILTIGLFAGWSLLTAPVRRLATAAVLMWLFMPLVIELLYQYRSYYGWMVTIPLLIALASIHANAGESGSLRRLASAAFVLAIVVGLPLRLALTFVEWHRRDYAPVENLVSRNVRANDYVYTDFSAYYPVAKRAAGVVLPLQVYPPYRSMLTAGQRSAITVLILGSETAADLSFFPGRWREVDRLSAVTTNGSFRFLRPFESQAYELYVYRRAL